CVHLATADHPEHGCAIARGAAQRLLDRVDGLHAAPWRAATAGQDQVAPPRQGPPARLCGAPPPQQPLPQGQRLEAPQVLRQPPGQVVVTADRPVAVPRRQQHQLRRGTHTATGALIAGAGSYPSIPMSPKRNSKMSRTEGLSTSRGKGRGDRDNCSRACSRWLEYRCASPRVWMNSPGRSPQTCATMWVSKA